MKVSTFRETKNQSWDIKKSVGEGTGVESKRERRF